MNVRPTSWKPIRKVSAGTLAGAITVILIAVLRGAFGVTVDADVQAALAVLITAIVAYLTPMAPDEVAPEPEDRGG